MGVERLREHLKRQEKILCNYLKMYIYRAWTLFLRKGPQRSGYPPPAPRLAQPRHPGLSRGEVAGGTHPLETPETSGTRAAFEDGSRPEDV